MKGKFSLRLVLALAAIPLAAGLAVAQGPAGSGLDGGPGFGEHRPPMERAFRSGGMHGHFWNNPKIVEKLQLTDQQRKEMDQAWQEHRENLIDLQATEEKAEVEMEPLMKADQPNETAILAQIDKIAAARAELEKANARFLLAIRAKLTPDQWKQVQEFREHPMPQGQWEHGGPNGRFRAPGQAQPQDGGSQGAPPPAPPQGGPSGDEE
ncbi:MAG TPA: Spy/CpxP family protein refolding chaperone [Terracidiphilus sp.]|nr:Spy/CpxP family protein refolding chaperone [Terracidiphilus sp.]